MRDDDRRDDHRLGEDAVHPAEHLAGQLRRREEVEAAALAADRDRTAPRCRRRGCRRGRPMTVVFSDISSATPRTMKEVPSVTMKAGTFSLAMIVPLTRPTSAGARDRREKAR